MSILSLLNPLSAVAEAAVPIIERFTTTPGESADAQVKIRKIALEEAKQADKPLADQRAINLVEAGHKSIFVSGWRPAVAWTCGGGLVLLIVVWPLGHLVAANSDFIMPEYPGDPMTTLGLLATLLGIGKIGRSFEKAKGVARSSMTGSASTTSEMIVSVPFNRQGEQR